MAYDLGLRCLQMSRFGTLGINGLNDFVISRYVLSVMLKTRESSVESITYTQICKNSS